MNRYLLFDSDCSLCSKLAKDIQRSTGDWLEARSLNDAGMRDLLEKTRPNWRQEPTLLEINNDRTRVFTGIVMRMYLALRLGPRRTLRMMKLVNRSSNRVKMADPSRRHFLKQIGGLFTSISLMAGLPRQWLGLSALLNVARQEPSSDSVDSGELYEGFLLLPDEKAPIPNFVQAGRAIGLCQTHSQHGSPMRGESVSFNSIEELRNHVSFPLYVPIALPSDFSFYDAQVLQYTLSGGIWAVMINYATYNVDTNTPQPRISLWAQSEYSRPYPVWPVHDFHFVPTSEEPEERVILPEKVSIQSLPPALLRPSAQGHVLLWIEEDVLYSLVAEHDPTREAVEDIAASLVRI